MTRETYFSPGTAPLERFARGVYGALPKSLEEANQMFNPLELLREAGGKSRRFFESGGRDRQAGIEALIDTAMLGVGPAAYGVASLFKTPIKKGTDFAQDAIQEAFNPLGASDDLKKFDPTETVYFRGEAGGRSAEKFDPEGRGIYISKSPKHAQSYTFKFTKQGPVFSDGATVYKVRLDENARIFDYKNPDHFKLVQEFYKKNKKKVDQFRFNDEESFLQKMKKGDFQAIENPFGDKSPAFEEFLKEKGFDGHKTGEPFRDKGKSEIAGNIKVYNASDIISAFDPLVQGKAQGGVVSLRDEARDMFRKPKGIASLTV